MSGAPSALRTRLVGSLEEGAGALVVLAGDDAAGVERCVRPLGLDAERVLALAAAAGAGWAVVPAAADSELPFDYLVVVRAVATGDEARAELRLRAMAAVRALPERVAALTVAAPAGGGADALRVLCEGALAGGDGRGGPRLTELRLVNEGSAAGTLEAAAVTAAATAWTRRMVELPSSELGPVELVRAAVELAQPAGLESRLWSVDDLRRERFAGLLAVARGAASAPALVELRYDGGAGPDLVLVGKAVTFDAGGMQVKQTRMEWNKADMAGGAAVLAAVWAAATLRLPVRLRALVPVAENLAGPDAFRPGDVVRHRNGRTTEIRNTDGEGRVLLADVLSYAAEARPDAIVDVATLTNPFGERISGVAANDDRLAADLAAASAAAGEPCWRLPLHHGYLADVASPVADLANYVPIPSAANDHALVRAMTAALFLEPFADGVPWAHLDIAGTAFRLGAGAGWPAGATGVPVATLVRWLEGAGRPTSPR